jgi:hypothetical protein
MLSSTSPRTIYSAALGAPDLKLRVCGGRRSVPSFAPRRLDQAVFATCAAETPAVRNVSAPCQHDLSKRGQRGLTPKSRNVVKCTGVQTCRVTTNRLADSTSWGSLVRAQYRPLNPAKSWVALSD